MSVCHVCAYIPGLILWTIRASLGFLFSNEVYNFLAGIGIYEMICFISVHFKFLFNNNIYNCYQHYEQLIVWCIVVVMRILTTLSGVYHIWNLYFYMKIEVFRNAMYTYVSCGYYIKPTIRSASGSRSTRSRA